MKTIVLVLSALIVQTLHAQVFFYDKNKKKWGLKSEYGKLLAPAIFDNVPRFDGFSHGLAAVSKDDKWGFIDTTGKQVIPLQYDYCENFSGWLAKVKKKDKYGYIDTDGKLVIPCKYESCESFSERLAAVSKDGWLFGYIDPKGKQVIPFKYVKAYGFSKGLARVQLEYDGDEIWYFIDKKGNNVAGPFGDAEPFSEGKAAVYGPGENGFYAWGFIDEHGKKFTPLKYEKVHEFSRGFARVKIDDRWLFLNKKAQLIGVTPYDACRSFNSLGLAMVQQDGKWGYIDENGLFAIRPRYDYLRGFGEGDEVTAARKGDKWGFVDKNGKEITPFKYDRCERFIKKGPGVAVINKLYGLVDRTGKEVVPFKYRNCGGLYIENFAFVQLVNGRYRFFDLKAGQEFGPFFDGLKNVYHEDMFAFDFAGKWGLFHVALKEEAVEAKYDDIKPFTDKMAAVLLDDHWGYIDHSGKEVIPFVFDEANLFQNGKAWVVKNGRGYFINKSGKEIAN